MIAFPEPRLHVGRYTCVSVIMIFYNAVRFISEALDSVLEQEYQDFELILVDDGSTDGSSEIARDYTDRNPQKIQYLQHDGHANRGISATRNLGVSAAQGEFVAFLDADDRWAPDKLHEQVEILRQLHEVDAVCGTVRYWQSWNGGEDRILPTGAVQNRPIRPPEAILSLYPLGKGVAPCPSDLMIRRAAIVELRGFEETFTGDRELYEDQAFLAKLYLAKTIYCADRMWLDYRIHDSSCVATAIRQGAYADARRYFLDWLVAYLDRNPQFWRPEIDVALKRALLPYRYPRIASILRRGRSALRKAKGE